MRGCVDIEISTGCTKDLWKSRKVYLLHAKGPAHYRGIYMSFRANGLALQASAYCLKLDRYLIRQTHVSWMTKKRKARPV